MKRLRYPSARTDIAQKEISNEACVVQSRCSLLNASALLGPPIKAPGIVAESPESTHAGLRPMALLLMVLLLLGSVLLLLLRMLALVGTIGERVLCECR